MMKPCTLYLVRHGQTTGNVNKLIHGHTDAPLTRLGERQAQKRKEQLIDIHFSKVYSSDLIRARHTAEILNRDRKLAHDLSPLLRERNYGTYEGKNQDEAQKLLWDLLSNDPRHPHIKETGVETNEQMSDRALIYLKKIGTAHPGENVLVVTHGGLLRVLLIHFGYVTSEQFPPGAIENLAYIKLEFDGSMFKVKETSGITLLAL